MAQTNVNRDGILVKGAREHNLKNIDVFIPRDQITVITGLSGSGKSSLAFDTIFAEGQRRFIESLSTYARQFLEQMKKPEVDAIEGLSPAIAIDQKSISTNPRSTVGTVTEVYDYLRLLFARVGAPHCPTHHVPLVGQTPQEIVDTVTSMKKGAKYLVLAPVVRGNKGEFLAEFQKWAKKGFARARVDGEWIELENAVKLARHKTHEIDLLVDRLVVEAKFLARLKESLNLSLGLADGLVKIENVDTGEVSTYSIHRSCPVCGHSVPDLEPRLFSFNNPRGACSTCNGLGTLDFQEVEQEVNQYGPPGEGRRQMTTTKYYFKNKKLDQDDDEDDEGGVDEYALRVCPDCKGSRLNENARNVLIEGRNITELSEMPSAELNTLMHAMKLGPRQALIGDKILKQIEGRLTYLDRVGAGYLSLSRPTRTLSGGEAQRIRLATQVGSGLVGVLYVLDEPSIGLHPRDHHRLLEMIQEIRDRGNTVLMVEHDEETIRLADHLIDMGPRAGRLGGEILAVGPPKELLADSQSVTGQYLSGAKQIVVPKERRKGSGVKIRLEGATGNNLKNVTLEIPLGTLTAITGVSGSGKSTLIIDTLYRILARDFNGSSLEPAPYKSIEGLKEIDKVIEINQRPIGRTPRSVPATYVGVFPMIRDLYANMPEAKMRGYRPGHFSFNVKGGRCEVCQGAGQIRVEMHFLSDVFVKCETCQGRRYNREILNIKFKDKSIADVLAMTVEEALTFFANHRHIHRKLDTLHRVGLDYMTLGQSSTTLSGGEAQRVKLSRELSKRDTGKTLYILDEPTTGLHFEDVKKLIDLLQELAGHGNTVIVIEHHLDVVKSADHVVDLGPEGGSQGGNIVAQGTPEKIVQNPKSITGEFLKPYLR
ncbi:MAG: excinuclease ABC subunit UvrA [Bdellovibrionales bacterium]|nr:excinuclease ABC subunit UvrA [Bdellovibrionales bacterium]